MNKRLTTYNDQYNTSPATPSPGKDVPGVMTSTRKKITAKAKKTGDSLRRSNVARR